MTRTRGCDVSHWQIPGAAFAQALWAWGARFVWIKVSQGGTGRDARGPLHWRIFGALGFKRGPYHYYDWRATPEANARNFLAAMDGMVWELRPVLDAEHGTAGDRESTAAALLVFLRLVEEGCGVVPAVYTYKSWWDATVAPLKAFLRFLVWVARYPNQYATGLVPAQGLSAPPAPWPAPVAAWQFATFGGVDRNITDDLTGLLAHPDSPPTTPPEDTNQELTMDAAVEARFIAIEKSLAALVANTSTKAVALRSKKDHAVWICSAEGRWHVPDMQTLNLMIFTGQVHGFGTDGVPEVTEEQLAGWRVLDRPV